MYQNLLLTYPCKSIFFYFNVLGDSQFDQNPELETIRDCVWKWRKLGSSSRGCKASKRLWQWVESKFSPTQYWQLRLSTFAEANQRRRHHENSFRLQFRENRICSRTSSRDWNDNWLPQLHHQFLGKLVL